VLPDTSILFYGTSLRGWDRNKPLFLNPYTNTNVYWLSCGGVLGRRDSISGVLTPNLETSTWFLDTIHIEKDNLCPAKSGLGWVWEKIERKKGDRILRKEYTFSAHNILNDSCTIRTAVYGWYSNRSEHGDLPDSMWHHLRIYLNNVLCLDTLWKGGQESPKIFESKVKALKEGTNTFTLELYKVEEEKDIIFFDWFEIIYKKRYSAYNGNLKFKGTKEEQKFELQKFDASPVIFNITNPIEPKLIYGVRYEGGVVKFKGTRGYYYASTNFKSVKLKKESPYSIRNIQENDIEFVIIAHPEFMDYAKLLKNHREKQGIKTKVFSVEEVYNNFSFGLRHSPYAIKNFLSFAYDRWNTSYCLLFGAGTFNYRDESLVKNRIPPYERGYKVGEYSYPPGSNACYDWWYTEKKNMAIGRITATSKEEARDVIVEKIFKYEKNPGVWQNRILLIADDEEPDGNLFVDHTEKLANQIPSEYDIFKVYSMNYPPHEDIKWEAKYDLIKYWSKGFFLTFFAGHGNLRLLTHERMLLTEEIIKLDNKIKLPFSQFSSCGVGCFERLYEHSMADYLQKIKNKGSIGSIASTRETSLSAAIPERIINLFLKTPQPTIGLGIYGIDFSLELPENCILFADPTTRLPQRTIEVKITSFPDTIKGGMLLRVQGEAEEANLAAVTVRSSEYTYVYPSTGARYKLRGRMVNYQLCEDILFQGVTKVNDGKWSYEFFVPVELDTLLCGPNGKISVFAWNDVECGNAAVRTVVTQGKPNPLDSVGPKIILYANGRLLEDTTLVPSSFTLTGVLEDESGINITNEIAPLDLALILQIGTQNPIPLTNYFQYDIGSGQRGSFNYPVELEGYWTGDEVTLKVQASDNLGNQSVYSVVVKILSSQTIELTRIMNYPNPVRGDHTYFIFFLSKSATIKIKIYTISGRLIRTLSPPKVFLAGENRIYWNTRDEVGNRVGNGIYLYKIEASSDEIAEDKTTVSSKLMILR
jgi:hypothetical protein